MQVPRGRAIVQRIRHQRAALLERSGKYKFALRITPIKGRSLVSLSFLIVGRSGLSQLVEKLRRHIGIYERQIQDTATRKLHILCSAVVASSLRLRS